MFSDSRLTEIGSSDSDYERVVSRMRDTISHKNKNDVKFNDYVILKVYKIDNDHLEQRFEEMKSRVERQVGETTEVWEAFHGSPDAWQIAQEGFDLDLGSHNSRFGRGVYFAPESSKANNYAFGLNKGCPRHYDNGCTRCVRRMLCCKIITGRQYSPKHFNDRAPAGYHTMHADPCKIRGLNYDEIAAFHPDLIQPLVLVEYRITNDALPQGESDLESAVEKMKNPDSGLLTGLAVAGAAMVAIPAAIYLVKTLMDSAGAGREQRRRQDEQQGGQPRPANSEEACVIS